jgi:hypothetical protein
MELAYACEVHHSLQAEILLAERHYRQTLFAARAYQLHIQTVRQQLMRVKYHVNTCFHVALRQAAVVAVDGEGAPEVEGVGLREHRKAMISPFTHCNG